VVPRPLPRACNALLKVALNLQLSKMSHIMRRSFFNSSIMLTLGCPLKTARSLEKCQKARSFSTISVGKVGSASPERIFSTRSPSLSSRGVEGVFG